MIILRRREGNCATAITVLSRAGHRAGLERRPVADDGLGNRPGKGKVRRWDQPHPAQSIGGNPRGPSARRFHAQRDLLAPNIQDADWGQTVRNKPPGITGGRMLFSRHERGWSSMGPTGRRRPGIQRYPAASTVSRSPDTRIFCGVKRSCATVGNVRARANRVGFARAG